MYLLYAQFFFVPNAQAGPLGSETFDIVFLFDGSNSITNASYQLQLDGIKNCITGSSAFIDPGQEKAGKGDITDFGA
jgi:hypothetical protein